MKVFLDINVILDAFLPNRVHRQSAEDILNLISLKRIEGYAASFSIATITYFLQKSFKENTNFVIEQLLSEINLVEMKKRDFLQGLSLQFKDLEDAYQVVAASKVPGLDFLLTQNVKDFKNSLISIIKPKDFLLQHL